MKTIPDGLRCDEHHEQNAVQNDVVKLKAAPQLLLVAERLDVLAEADSRLLDGL